MNKRSHVIEAEAEELEAEVLHYATVASALGERISWYANKLAAERLDNQRVLNLAHEVMALQGAVPRTLMELNNAVIALYDANRNR